MKSREPAGQERGGGRSAELSVRARTEGGPVRNPPGTVRGISRGSAIRLQGTPRLPAAGGERICSKPGRFAGRRIILRQTA